MQENKNNLLFLHSSSTPTSLHNFDQNSAPTLTSTINDHEMSRQLFSSIESGDWTNNEENHNHKRNLETTQCYPSSSTPFIDANDNFETPRYYHPSSSQSVDPNSNYSNMDDAFLFSDSLTCSPSILSTTHNKDSFNDSIGHNGFLSDVVNSSSTKTSSKSLDSMTFNNRHSPYPNPQTSHFYSPSSISTTHNNDQFADSTEYTGLLSDIVKMRPRVPTMSSSTTNLSSLPPRPPSSHNSLNIKNNNIRNYWSLKEHRYVYNTNIIYATHLSFDYRLYEVINYTYILLQIISGRDATFRQS